MARLGLKGVERFVGLLGRRSSGAAGLRSIHAAPSSGGRTETPDQDPGDPSASPAAAARPRWAVLHREGICRDRAAAHKAWRDPADPRTTNGRRHLRVYFDLVTPPESSFLRFDWEPGDKEVYNEKVAVVATHGDSVLVHMKVWRGFAAHTTLYGYFVYRVGAARPPDLTLLSTEGVPEKLNKSLYEGTTGLLRRGDDEVLVVLLDLMYTVTGPRSPADLVVLRVGTSEWRRRSAAIVLDEGTEADALRQWCTSNTVVPVGDRFLCWVNYRCGFLLSDMADEASPKLRYVPLPVNISCCGFNHEIRSRNMCAAGADAVRFVSVNRRCLSGGPGSKGYRGVGLCKTAFTVATWTLSRLSTDTDEPLAWVKDGELDCEELWALPGYKGLPRVLPRWPVVSPDNPDVVCFVVCRHRQYDDEVAWKIEVDTRNKEVLSVVNSTDSHANFHFPVKLQS